MFEEGEWLGDSKKMIMWCLSGLLKEFRRESGGSGFKGVSRGFTGSSMSFTGVSIRFRMFHKVPERFY